MRDSLVNNRLPLHWWW